MSQPAKRRGRPPEGLGKKGEPERIRDYPRRLFTMRPSTLARLHALGEHEGRAEWKIVEDAIAMYFDSLLLSEQREVQRASRD